jgi:hypothetical protein
VVVQNNKDYLDQSLDEIKLLKYVNQNDPDDEHNILQLYDYFYYKVLHAYNYSVRVHSIQCHVLSKPSSGQTASSLI